MSEVSQNQVNDYSAKSVASINKKKANKTWLTSKQILALAKKESLQKQVALLDKTFETIDTLQALLRNRKMIAIADELSLIDLRAKIESLEEELAELNKKHKLVCKEYARLKDIKLIKDEFHQGCPQLSADS